MYEADDDLAFEFGFRLLAGIIGILAGVFYGVCLSVVDGTLRPLAISSALGVLIAVFAYWQIGAKLASRFSGKFGRVGWWNMLEIDYASALLLTIFTHVLYRAVYPHGLGTTFTFFMLPVILAALLVNIPCAIVSALLAFFYVLYFAIPPVNSFRIETLQDLANAGIFCAILCTVIYVVRVARILSGDLEADAAS